MAMLFDLAGMTTATTGTGTITLDSAVSGCLTFDDAGVPDGAHVRYGIRDGAHSEVGTGIYTASGTTLTREVIKSTNGDAEITLSGAAKVFIVGLAEDIASIPECGRFSYVSATAVKFAPYKGDQIKIDGNIYRIPSAGIAGGANTGVYVDGVAGQNLAASTTYNVYAFNNAGTITMDFSTTGRATSTTPGNVGVEIKNGDNTRTLIGKVVTNSSSQFVDTLQFRYVISWFNRRNIKLIAAFTAARSTTSITYTEVNSEIRNWFLTWGEDAVHVNIDGAGDNNTANRVVQTSFGFDSTSTPEDCYSYEQAYASGASQSVTLSYVKDGLSEGAHYVTLLGTVGSLGTPGTARWYGGSTPGDRTTLSTMIRG